jgi:hypothetical protein
VATGGLTRWFKEQWVDISRPKKGGGFEPCGRKDADEGKYPKCVPASRAAKMTEAEIKSAVSRKRRAESTERREDKKPINVKTKVEKKNVPTNPKLYAEVKAAAKRKFDVYPSAYANGWLVQEYKRRGGKYKTVTKGYVGLVKHVEHDQKTHGRRKTAGSSKEPADADDFQAVLARAQIRAATQERPKALSKWQGPETFDERLTRCYELSWKTISKISGGGEGHQLVHGSIHGPGSSAGRIPHAWVELADGTVFDPVLDLWFSPDEWERGFSAEAAVKYDFDEVGRQSAASMNMGPWHDAPYGNKWYEERGSDG